GFGIPDDRFALGGVVPRAGRDQRDAVDQRLATRIQLEFQPERALVERYDVERFTGVCVHCLLAGGELHLLVRKAERPNPRLLLLTRRYRRIDGEFTDVVIVLD